MENWNDRTILLLGKEKYKKLENAKILVVGNGGVGSMAAEALVRAGIGNITLVDSDEIRPSNINRQVIALHSNIGQKKVEVLKNRLLDINPYLNIKTFSVFLKDKEIDELLSEKFDYVLDAIDTLTPKINLIVKVLEKKYPLISSMGSGGRTKIEKIQIADISKSYNCKLARHVRKRLHKLGIYTGFKVIFSPEQDNRSFTFVKEENKKTTFGTISYLPMAFGLFAASEIINDLIKG